MARGFKEKKRIKSKESDIIAVQKDISIKVNRYDWEKCMTNAIKHQIGNA